MHFVATKTPKLLSVSYELPCSPGGGHWLRREHEPTLRDNYSLVQQYSASLSLLTGQGQAICEDVSLIRHNLHKVWECMMVLESCVSEIKDTVSPLVTEVKAAMHKLNITSRDELDV